MGDSYIECLVGRDKNQGYYILRIIMFVICGVSVVLALMGIPVMLIVAIAFLLVGLFVVPPAEVEYEYLLVGKELSIDMIIAKEKRKHVASYDLNKMELMCPLNSHELDSYKNKKTPYKDCSSQKEGVVPYVIVCRDEKSDQLVYVEPEAEFINAIKTVCPRKVVEY